MAKANAQPLSGKEGDEPKAEKPEAKPESEPKAEAKPKPKGELKSAGFTVYTR